MSDLDWHPVETAPWQKPVWVKNPVMQEPVLATRGYVVDGAVHADSTFFTSVRDPIRRGYLAFPAGRLVCPTQWAPYTETPANTAAP